MLLAFAHNRYNMARSNKNNIPLGSSVSPRGGGYSSPPQLNDKESTYSELLQNSAGNDAFALFLASLGIEQTKGLTGSQRDDYNKQLLDTLLSYLLTQENREYNEKLLKEQRLYDSPTNALARLMGAGISRDAAIQMLSGGSGSGGSAPYSDPAQVLSNLPASQSQLNGIQAATTIANTVFNGVSSVANLVSLGFSIPQAVQQTKILQSQAYLTDKQKKAYDTAVSAHDIVLSANVENAADVFGSVAKTAQTIEQLASSGNESAQAFVSSGGLEQLRSNSLYCGQFLNQMYKNERDSADYEKNFDAALRLAQSQADLNEINRDKLCADIEQINALIDKIHAEEDFIEGQTALLTWHEKKFKSDIEVNNAHIELLSEQAQQLDLQNRVESTFLTSSYNGKTGLTLLTDYRANEMLYNLRKLVALRDSKAWEKEVDSFLANQDNLLATYQLEYLYKSGQLDYMANNPDASNAWLYYARTAQECGLFDYMDAITNASASGNIKVGPFGASTHTNMPFGVPYAPYR